MGASIKLEISDFLGFCDLNGVEALDSAQVEQLENYIHACNKSMNEDKVPLVADGVYDKLTALLKAVNPDAEVLSEIWSEDDEDVEVDMEKDIYRHLKAEPMRSICTCKSFDCPEILKFVSLLPSNTPFEAHMSVKENGHGIRCVYSYGYHEDSTSRARNSAGHNLKRQMDVILGNAGLLNIESLEDLDTVEIRGELVLPFNNLSKAREHNPEIVSAFSGVSSMIRDSASDEEVGLLRFVAYKIIGDGFNFETKEDEYNLLESLGFMTPLYWVIPNLTKETFLDELPSIVEDCANEVAPDSNGEGGYEFFTDGLVLEVNSRELFVAMGQDGKKYNFGNIALKVGYWKQDMYSGYIQTIMWTKGKSKLSPVAIIADELDLVSFQDGCANPYITDIKQISNWKELGVVTAAGNKVRRVPLYEPNNMLLLDAYPNSILFFRYGGEAGVVPCFSDGTPLSAGKVRQALEADSSDDDYWAYDCCAETEYEGGDSDE